MVGAGLAPSGPLPGPLPGPFPDLAAGLLGALGDTLVARFTMKC
jgi:hypothetical protein